MATFEWFVFRPLSFDEFVSHFQIDIEQAHLWYTWWTEDYNHLAKRFYLEHYKRHELLEFWEFCRANSLKLDYPEELGEYGDDEDYCDAWEYWKNNAELLQLHHETIKPLLKLYASSLRSSSADELVRKYLQMIEQGWTAKPKNSAKALWFNSNIVRPSNADLAALRSLSYSNYRESSHWRKVRAAMLLIEQAHCKDCIGGDSFYGGDWERAIHVHHLHYRNLGCERYEDLCLLCEEHHKQTHSH